MKNSILRGSVLVLTLALASLGSLHAQEPHQTQPSPDTPQAGQPSAPQPSTQVQTAREFTGTIVKEGNSLRLKDDAGNANYKLDGQSKAKAYVGKQVKVTGKLDTSSNVIQVTSVSAMP